MKWNRGSVSFLWTLVGEVLLFEAVVVNLLPWGELAKAEDGRVERWKEREFFRTFWDTELISPRNVLLWDFLLCEIINPHCFFSHLTLSFISLELKAFWVIHKKCFLIGYGFRTVLFCFWMVTVVDRKLRSTKIEALSLRQMGLLHFLS